MQVSMRTRKRSTGVAIMANSSAMAMRNAEPADGSPKDSYAAVVAPPPRIQGGDTDVAANTPAARDTKAKLPSPPAPAPREAPAEVPLTRKAPAPTAEKASPASGRNDGVADEAPGKLAKPPSPLAPTAPAAGAIAEEVVAQLAEKGAQIRDLQAQIDKHKEAPKRKAATITMSTEAVGVPEDSNEYWVDVDAKRKKKTNVVVKSGAKPDSRSGLRWPGYCVEGCGCAVCVVKREEPNKTEMLNLKRVSKRPST